MSRHGPNSDRITIARLCGTATRHAGIPDTDESVAVGELVAMATEHRRGVGLRFRVDLLSEAAGSLLGGYRYNPRTYWSGEAAAGLLITAGADEDLVEQHATATLARLRGSAAAGIGHMR